MSRQFTIPTILRMLPNKLLERLFAERGYIQLRWNWKGLKERDVEKLQYAINMQPAESKALIESDLHELFELACDSGMTSILEAALQCGLPDFADRMPEEGFYYRSIWTRLEYPAVFERALARILLVLVEEQLAAKQVTPEQFLEGLAGDALAQATDAFIEELVDFFPDARGRAGLRTLLSKFREVRELAINEAETRLEKIDAASVVKKSFGSSTRSPAKSASRRKPSRSGNST